MSGKVAVKNPEIFWPIAVKNRLTMPYGRTVLGNLKQCTGLPLQRGMSAFWTACYTVGDKIIACDRIIACDKIITCDRIIACDKIIACDRIIECVTELLCVTEL